MGVKVKVNGENVDVDLSDVTNLSSLLDHVSADFLEPQELIMELAVNGESVDISDETIAPDQPLEELNVVEIDTLKYPSLKVIELIVGVEEYIGGLSPKLPEVADIFRLGNSDEANAMLFYVLDGVASFSDLVGSARAISRKDLDNLSISGVSLAELEKKSVELLYELKSAQEKSDWVSVADILEYELAENLDSWKEMLPRIRGELEASAN